MGGCRACARRYCGKYGQYDDALDKRSVYLQLTSSYQHIGNCTLQRSVFFFDRNADFLVECLESCLEPGKEPKYSSVTVHDWIVGRYADTFGGGEVKGEKDLVSLE